MTPLRSNPDGGAPLLDFEQTRRANLALFQRSTAEQRVQWLGNMLELMRLAHEARRKPDRQCESISP